MPFNNPIIGNGGNLIRDWMQSVNYVPGVSGWRISKDGDAEFNAGTFRSDLLVVDADGSYVRVSTLGTSASIALRPPDDASQVWNPARVFASLNDIAGGGPGSLAPSLVVQGPSENNSVVSSALNAVIPAVELVGPTDAVDASTILLRGETLILNDGLVSDNNSTTLVGLEGTLFAGSQWWGVVTINPAGGSVPTSIGVAGIEVASINGVYFGYATANTTVIGTTVLGVAITGVSGTGCTVWVNRTNTTATSIYYAVIGQ